MIFDLISIGVIASKYTSVALTFSAGPFVFKKIHLPVSEREQKGAQVKLLMAHLCV